MNIGIISDTHGYLHPKFKTILSTCDTIIHGGDFASNACYQELLSLQVPMYMVRGNCDYGGWATYLPQTLSFSIDGHLFYLIHDKSKIGYPFPETEFLIHGHTHKYEETNYRGVHVINPGSASESRTSLPPSIGILTLNKDGYTLERIFDHDQLFPL